jgi:hypothetical protein
VEELVGMLEGRVARVHVGHLVEFGGSVVWLLQESATTDRSEQLYKDCGSQTCILPAWF